MINQLEFQIPEHLAKITSWVIKTPNGKRVEDIESFDYDFKSWINEYTPNAIIKKHNLYEFGNLYSFIIIFASDEDAVLAKLTWNLI